MVKDAQIIATAIAKVATPTFGVAEEFLKVHSVALKKCNPESFAL